MAPVNTVQLSHALHAFIVVYDGSIYSIQRICYSNSSVAWVVKGSDNREVPRETKTYIDILHLISEYINNNPQIMNQILHQ